VTSTGNTGCFNKSFTTVLHSDYHCKTFFETPFKHVICFQRGIDKSTELSSVLNRRQDDGMMDNAQNCD
jgi:hypothetical protein